MNHSLSDLQIPVIILNWNGWEDTLQCLRSLEEQKEVSEVWLVDNGSSLDRTEECRKVIHSLRVIKLNENYGWAGGYNRALKLAVSEGYEFAYLLNNDSIASVGFLREAYDVMMRNIKFAAVGSLIVYADKKWIKFDGRYYSPGERRFALGDHAANRLTREANGAGMLVRLESIQKNGWFDERFFCYAEETEWCWRMSSRGWQVAMALSSVVFHRSEGSDTNANALYYRNRNKFLLLEHANGRRTMRQTVHLIRSLMVGAYNCLTSMDITGHRAILAAVRDGLCSRFGKRDNRPLGLLWSVVSVACMRIIWFKRILGFRPR